MKWIRARCILFSVFVSAPGTNMDPHIPSCKEVKQSVDALFKIDELNDHMLNAHQSRPDVKYMKI